MRALLATLLLTLCIAFSAPGAQAACTVDINTASSSALQGLPGIGPAKAAAIIDYRESAGPFSSIDQLTSVNGIGDATLSNVRDMACVAGDADASAAASTTSAETAAETGAETSTAATTAAAPQEATTSTSTSGQVDVNTATATQLDALPGIGPAKAAAIVGERDANGPFSSCDDLTRVTGIGPATVAKLAGTCTASGAAQ